MSATEDEDYYEILGVERNATAEDIKKALVQYNYFSHFMIFVFAVTICMGLKCSLKLA